MEVEISWRNGCKNVELPNDENIFYKNIAELLASISAPNFVAIQCFLGIAKYQIVTRSNTLFIKEQMNTIHLSKTDYPSCYLVCVNPEHNNYKFYRLDHIGDDVVATYGRIGSQPGEIFGKRTYTYPTRMYWIKYYEKLSKGYVDKSKLYLQDKTEHITKNKEQESQDPATILYNQLVSYAKGYVEKTLIDIRVTDAMVKETKRLLKILYQRKTVKAFNIWLVKLLSVSPRKVSRVADLLAKTPNDFVHIIDREENLLFAMEALASKTNSNKSKTTGFKNLNIEIYYANEKQKEEVLSHLDSQLKTKVKTIYRVIDKKKQNRFNDYLKRENITKVKQLWHGSRNENWYSIIKNGLVLNPDAIITGKMFGDGIYFAPKASKSWNYTSFHGTYWANGCSDVGFMGLYATGYGDPLDVYSSHAYRASALQGKNCVHAHAGTSLKNDEIIYYSEDAVLINYIVEFR